jgi:hypothetical protein
MTPTLSTDTTLLQNDHGHRQSRLTVEGWAPTARPMQGRSRSGDGGGEHALPDGSGDFLRCEPERPENTLDVCAQ